MASPKEDDIIKKFTETLKSFYDTFNDKCDDYEGRKKTETGMTAPLMEPFGLRMAHRANYEKVKKEGNPYRIDMKTSSASEAVVSTTPFDDLKRTRIRKLLINVPAKGFYLLARTIEPPTVLVGMNTIIEDHTGDVYTFALYNFLDPDSSIPPEEVLPVGTVFVLKEPLLKSAVSGYIIRCDSPTDIVILSKHNKLHHLAVAVSWRNVIVKEESKEPTTREQWKKLGNEMFQNGLYFKALESYFMALKHTDDNDISIVKTLYSNISMAYLKLECYEDALSSAKKVLEQDPKHTKALYRAGKAHYELRQYAEAESFFKEIVKQEPENEVVIQQLSKCASRIEEKKGKIDINRLFWAQSENPRTELDCADYVGPIEVVPVPGKGRGVVAKEDIKTGTLLCVSKAIKFCFADPSHGLTLQKTEGENKGFDGESVRLIAKLAQCVLKNPNVFGTMIYDLATISCKPKAKLFCNEETKNEPIVDVQQIRDIVSCNVFSLDGLLQVKGERGAGLFILPSYINHSCCYNAFWQVYNDVMVIHAVKDIRCGEEVYVPYVDNLDSFHDRNATFSNFKFQCCCFLCELDRKESPDTHSTRDNLVKQFVNPELLKMNFGVQHPNTALLHELQHIIAKVEETYTQSNRSQLKTSLCRLYTYLASLYMQRSEIDLLLEALEKALNSLGLSGEDLFHFAEHDKTITKAWLMSYDLIPILQIMASAFVVCGKPSEGCKWLKVLFVFCEKCFGINAQTATNKFMIEARSMSCWTAS